MSRKRTTRRPALTRTGASPRRSNAGTATLYRKPQPTKAASAAKNVRIPVAGAVVAGTQGKAPGAVVTPKRDTQVRGDTKAGTFVNAVQGAIKAGVQPQPPTPNVKAAHQAASYQGFSIGALRELCETQGKEWRKSWTKRALSKS